MKQVTTHLNYIFKRAGVHYRIHHLCLCPHPTMFVRRSDWKKTLKSQVTRSPRSNTVLIFIHNWVDVSAKFTVSHWNPSRSDNIAIRSEIYAPNKSPSSPGYALHHPDVMSKFIFSVSRPIFRSAFLYAGIFMGKLIADRELKHPISLNIANLVASLARRPAFFTREGNFPWYSFVVVQLRWWKFTVAALTN